MKRVSLIFIHLYFVKFVFTSKKLKSSANFCQFFQYLLCVNDKINIRDFYNLLLTSEIFFYRNNLINIVEHE